MTAQISAPSERVAVFVFDADGRLIPRLPRVPDGVVYLSVEQAAARTGFSAEYLRQVYADTYRGILDR